MWDEYDRKYVMCSQTEIVFHVSQKIHILLNRLRITEGILSTNPQHNRHLPYLHSIQCFRRMLTHLRCVVGYLWIKYFCEQVKTKEIIHRSD